jgi:oligopeptide/dipeptide ABC transporter ATP-binding protein
LIQISDLKKTYATKAPFKDPVYVQALRGVSFQIQEGETLAVVGESGCGKSTLAKILLGIETATSGSIKVSNQEILSLKPAERVSLFQMVFQDPNSSFNPRKRIFDIIAEPLVVQGLQKDLILQKVNELSSQVGINEEMLKRYPHQLSGGQRQRVGIARALITGPKVVICDEPVSALDVSVQAQVLNLLLDLRKKNNLTYLFISHDLSVVRFVAHRVAVMYLGRFVEIGTTQQIFTAPKHPYTRLLLGSADLAPIDKFSEGELPSPLRPPSGCTFHTRCPWAQDICKTQVPELAEIDSKLVACHRKSEVLI